MVLINYSSSLMLMVDFWWRSLNLLQALISRKISKLR